MRFTHGRNLKDLLNASTPYAQAGRNTREGDTADGSQPKEDSSSKVCSDTPEATVFVPIRPIIEDGNVVMAYEFRQRESGPPYLPVFSTSDKLIDQLGDIQTRLEITFTRLLELIEVHYIEIDPEIDRSDWRWNDEDVSRYSELLKKAVNGDE
ncbi:hypothetical protein ACQPZ8_10475 [Actinomadura nitritigenes]|uniref:hypothetical protein n=1 Tax=Actinomadura nitritigenes TaxID=134602 RepID=UPI003D922686